MLKNYTYANPSASVQIDLQSSRVARARCCAFSLVHLVFDDNLHKNQIYSTNTLEIFSTFKLPEFLVNTPRGVLSKVPFFDLHMSAENTLRGVFSRSRQTTNLCHDTDKTG